MNQGIGSQEKICNRRSPTAALLAHRGAMSSVLLPDNT